MTICSFEIENLIEYEREYSLIYCKPVKRLRIRMMKFSSSITDTGSRIKINLSKVKINWEIKLDPGIDRVADSRLSIRDWSTQTRLNRLVSFNNTNIHRSTRLGRETIDSVGQIKRKRVAISMADSGVIRVTERSGNQLKQYMYRSIRQV